LGVVDLGPGLHLAHRVGTLRGASRLLAWWAKLMWLTALWWVGYNTLFHELVEEHEDFANRWSDIVSRGLPVILFVILDGLGLAQRFRGVRWLQWLVED